MLPSLRSKIIALVLLILVTTAAGIMFFTKKDVGTAMLQAEVRSVSNALGLVQTTIEGEYTGILRHKVTTILDRKKQLRQLASAVMSICHEYQAMTQLGFLTEPQAKKRALELIRDINIGSKSKATIIDKNLNIILHPENSLVGTSLAGHKDMKGQPILKGTRGKQNDFHDKFSVFYGMGDPADAGKQLGYFHPIPGWDWTIGTIVDIDDITAQGKAKIQELLNMLKTTLNEIRIVGTGTILIFDSANDILIAPSHGQTLSHGMMRRLISRRTSTDEFITYTAKKDGISQPMLAKGFYFKPLDWYVATLIPTEEIQEPANTLVRRQFFLILAVSLLALILAIAFITRISKPINKLAEFAKKLPQQDLTKEFAIPASIEHLTTYHDEVGRLARSFVYMISSLRTNVTNLMEVTASKERIQSELNVAKEIQEGILPKIFPAFPDRSEIQLFASLESAKQVGGDLYDFFFINDKHLCFVIGDVSDKGVPAALFMAITMTLIRSMAEAHDSPAEIMVRVNDKLSRENPNSMFVTLFIGIMDTQTGHVIYASGGHNPPILIKNNGETMYKEGISGLVVGGMEGMPYKELTFDLEPGETVFLYTDGVTEALNPAMDLFSEAQLLDEVILNRNAAPQVLIEKVRERVRTHVGTAPQSDDITMLVLRYLGQA